MRRRQQTLAGPVTLSGTGLHVGEHAEITFKPAPVDHGFTFRRTDIEGSDAFRALADVVFDTRRGTSIRSESGAEIRTIEHALSALAGLQVDNCSIEISGVEVPALDGSSRPFADAFCDVGFRDQRKGRRYIDIDRSAQHSVPEANADFHVHPAEEFRATTFLEYDGSVIPAQHAELNSLSSQYLGEISSARTYCLLSEVDRLRKFGLIRGGSLDNAVVLVDEGVDEGKLPELCTLLGVSLEEVSGMASGASVRNDLRYPNEPARHKLLDLVGDLALLGFPLAGHVVAFRPGHTGNVEFARWLSKRVRENKLIKRYDPDMETAQLPDIQKIMEVLPHRYPFLLVDRVLDRDDENGVLTALKNVTINEPFFQGHFPGLPVMPGVLIVEALAQAGGLLMVEELKGDDDRIAFFMGIKEAKFRRPVRPGDALHLVVRREGKRFNTFTISGKALVEEKVVAEATLSVALVDRSGNGQ